MIVPIGSKEYASDEYCDECDHCIPTDGEFAIHVCPLCGGKVTPCNICPDNNGNPDCNNCRAKGKMARIAGSAEGEAK